MTPTPPARLLLGALLLAAAAPATAQSTVRPLPLQRWRELGPRTADATFRRPSAQSSEGIPVEAGFTREETASAREQDSRSTYALLRPFLEASAGAALDGDSGEIGTQRGGFDATLGFLRERSELALHVFTEASFYDFGGPSGALATFGDPFNDLYRTGLGVEGLRRLDEELAWRYGIDLVLGGEDEVSPTDSAQLGGMLALRYEPSETGSLTLGIAAQSRLEDDPWVVPFLGFRWQASEDLAFELEGPEASASLALSDQLQARLGARYELRQYRLNENGPLAGGAFRDEEIRALAGLDWRPKPGLECSLSVGRTLWREIDLRDTRGNELVNLEAADANWVGLSLTISF